ncbi:MAG: hypothetical protein ACRDMX_09440, partial [Solirubrobacteraceae bacterium]
MTASRISTRTVAAVAAIGTGLALAACGGSAVSSATSAASAASSAATSAASGASSAATSAASG